MSRYKVLYCDRKKVWPLAVSRYSIARAAIRREARACVAIQTLYRDRGAATMRYNASLRATIRPPRPTTRPATSHDTVPCARFLGAVRAACACSLGSGCAPSAPNPVLDLVHCFSHCLDHYS